MKDITRLKNICTLWITNILSSTMLVNYSYLYVISLFPSLIEGVVYNSLHLMQLAAVAERDLPKLIRSHVESELERIEQLRAFADELESQHQVDPPLSLSYLEENVTEPINVYRYVKHGHDLTKQVQHLLVPVPSENLTVALANLPNDEDFSGVISALMRLDEIYPSLTNIFHGASESLTAEEIYKLVDHLSSGSDINSALRLAEKLRKRYELDHHEDGVWTMIDYIAYLHDQNGDTEWAVYKSYEVLNYWKSVGNKDYAKRVRMNIKNYLEKLKEDDIVYDPNNLPELDEESELIEYRTLCNGEQLPDMSPKPLYCYYSTQNNHPLLRLSPVKVEVINEELPLVYIHNFLTDGEIQYLMTTATNYLEESEVVTHDETVVETQSRSSLTAWLADGLSKIIENISGRISAVTNLDSHSAEHLQVLSYGIGGYYEPHFDYAEDDQMNAFGSHGGNRIATWIFYLNDVKKGGGTVFPELGVTVWPEAGGAAFWMNLHKNGSGNPNTLHAACPVLEGYKWVANKWFHQHGNEFRHPCDIDEDL